MVIGYWCDSDKSEGGGMEDPRSKKMQEKKAKSMKKKKMKM